jgi:PKD repeat protein
VKTSPGGASRPKGIDRIVVGVMNPIVLIMRVLLVSMVLALVIIFVRGDIVMDAKGEGLLTPVADAGPDQDVTGPVMVSFDGTASSDDLGIERYEWEFTYGGGTVLLEGAEPEHYFAAHGVYEVILTVTDGSNATDTDSMTLTVVTVPGVIERVSVIGRNNWVEIGWSDPVHDGGSPITGAIVFRGTTPDTLEPYFSDWWIRGWSWDYLAVNGITYYYAVTALNEAGMGPMSEIVNATPMAVPDTPQNLTVEVVDDAVHLAWDPPLWSSGRVNVTGYQVHRGTDPDWLYDTFEVGLDTTFVDEDVEEGVTYYYTVGCDSSFGGSSVTELMNVTVGDVEEEPTVGTDDAIAVGVALLVFVALGAMAYLALRGKD